MAELDKAYLNIAGEFLVAGELNRRHVQCSVTYGSSKAADLFALSDETGKVVRIEVKTTDKAKWPVGGKVFRSDGAADRLLWVFVFLPGAGTAVGEAAPPMRGECAPRFFVLTGSQVRDIARSNHDNYSRKYEAKHGKPYPEGEGVPQIRVDQLAQHESCWDKIKVRLASAEENAMASQEWKRPSVGQRVHVWRNYGTFTATHRGDRVYATSEKDRSSTDAVTPKEPLLVQGVDGGYFFCQRANGRTIRVHTNHLWRNAPYNR